jgi:hypothetical protein
MHVVHPRNEEARKDERPSDVLERMVADSLRMPPTEARQEPPDKGAHLELWLTSGEASSRGSRAEFKKRI